MSKRNNLQDLIDRANKVHNNKYDYSLIKNYNSMHDYQDIICPKHGVFKVPLHWHINKGRGCPGCALENSRDTKDDFIEKANKVHNNKYDYSKVNYINARTKIEIICPKHGSFFQMSNYHLTRAQGCPICKQSKGEILISKILQLYNINFVPQHHFNDLRYKKQLYFDFYLPELNMCIEYDGEQHFRIIPGMTNDDVFKEIQIRDKLKTEYCLLHNIPFLRLTYKDKDEDIKRKVLNFLDIKESLITKFSFFILNNFSKKWKNYFPLIN